MKKKHKTEYTVVTGVISDFEEEVTKKLNQNWEPLGSLVVLVGSGGELHYFREMTRTLHPPKSDSRRPS